MVAMVKLSTRSVRQDAMVATHRCKAVHWRITTDVCSCHRSEKAVIQTPRALYARC